MERENEHSSTLREQTGYPEDRKMTPKLKLAGDYEDNRLQWEENQINDCIYFGSKALKAHAEILNVELIVYIIGIEEVDIRAMYDSSESEVVFFPRKGQSNRGFHCIKYHGEYVAAANGPMTTLGLTQVTVEKSSDIEVSLKWI